MGDNFNEDDFNFDDLDDGFGSMGSFDDENDDIFGDNSDDSFNDNDNLFQDNNNKQNSNNNNLDFSDTVSNIGDDNEQQIIAKENNKKALIMVCAGIAVIILIIIIGAAVGRKRANSENVDVASQDERPSQNVDDTIKDKDVQTQHNIETDSWVEITADEDISFKDEYSEMTFTITGIQHQARVFDTNSNLEIRTMLTGSIAGLGGTFHISVPYNKGCKLVIGDTFNIKVQIGEYNGKTVVADIVY